jgi:hypothetical protein
MNMESLIQMANQVAYIEIVQWKEPLPKVPLLSNIKVKEGS